MILRAKYLMCDSRTVIENGGVAVHESEILEAGPYASIRVCGRPVRDLGNAVIMPGFVNAHIHLELTNHRNLITRTPRFTDWILQILRHQERDQASIDRAIHDGVEMSLAGGATTIADIHASGKSAQTLKDVPLRKTVFFETTGFSPQRTQFGIDRLNRHLAASPATDSLFTLGVSPHAPYSTSSTLYCYCLQQDLPLCTHLSETEEEVQFLSSGTGAFAGLLDKLQISREGWSPPGVTPVQYMTNLGLLTRRPLLAHCNYLTQKDIQILANTESSVVFCPRSHHYFSHVEHPIADLIAAGVNVAIGTDSHASNWSLSMLDELRFLATACDKLSPETLIDLVTINGARALGMDRVGKLQQGWRADLIAVHIDDNRRSVIGGILGESAQNLLTVVNGEIQYDRIAHGC